jgi:broad specificity phosphatase PhoE
LIRHARPSAIWTEELDAGLDATGEQQAQAVAQTLEQTLTRMPIYTSPLQRCRETARPLEELWKQAAEVLEPVAEIPSPANDPLDEKGWLKQAMGGTWQELYESAPPDSPDYLAWRAVLLHSLSGIEQDSIVFSHYVAINVVVGAAQSREKVVCFRPDHASVTCVDVTENGLTLVTLGCEIDSTVT